MGLHYGGFKSLAEIVQHGRSGVWRYSGALPFSADPVTLGEGGTPLVRAKHEGRELFLKLEYASPTGAFKDRGAAVSVTRAVAVGAGGIVEDSSGNAGVAASAYAARAGIRARIYVPEDAPKGKKLVMEALGAEVVECPTREGAASRSVSELADWEVYIGHAWDPFYLEGMKTAAFEVFEAGVSPDVIITPVASGTLLLGLHKGYRELLDAGLIDRMPRICGVQGESCAPIYEEIHGKLTGVAGSRLADGLRISNPPRKAEIVDAIRSTDGDVYTVSDPEIVSALRWLLGKGIIAEPTSATALAAFLNNKCERVGTPMIPITGAGMKDLVGLVAALRGSA